MGDFSLYFYNALGVNTDSETEVKSNYIYDFLTNNPLIKLETIFSQNLISPEVLNHLCTKTFEENSQLDHHKGDTLLHLSVRSKTPSLFNYLLSNTSVNPFQRNAKNQTVLDLINKLKEGRFIFLQTLIDNDAFISPKPTFISKNINIKGHLALGDIDIEKKVDRQNDFVKDNFSLDKAYDPERIKFRLNQFLALRYADTPLSYLAIANSILQNKVLSISASPLFSPTQYGRWLQDARSEYQLLSINGYQVQKDVMESNKVPDNLSRLYSRQVEDRENIHHCFEEMTCDLNLGLRVGIDDFSFLGNCPAGECHGTAAAICIVPIAIILIPVGVWFAFKGTVELLSTAISGYYTIPHQVRICFEGDARNDYEKFCEQRDALLNEAVKELVKPQSFSCESLISKVLTTSPPKTFKEFERALAFLSNQLSQLEEKFNQKLPQSEHFAFLQSPSSHLKFFKPQVSVVNQHPRTETTPCLGI